MTTESFKQMLRDALKDWHDESWKAEGAMLALNQVLHRVEIEEKWQNEESQKRHAQEEQENADTADKVKLSDEPDRDSRPRERLLIVDGEHHHFKNGQDMLDYFDLRKYYGKFMHLLQLKGGRENLVEYEANALRKILFEKWQMRLESYTAHGFDGLPKTIMFEKEEEEKDEN